MVHLVTTVQEWTLTVSWVIVMLMVSNVFDRVEELSSEDLDYELEYFIPWMNEEIISNMWPGHIWVASFVMNLEMLSCFLPLTWWKKMWVSGQFEFLSYLHELFVDLNNNCSQYTQGLIDSHNVKIRYSLRSITYCDVTCVWLKLERVYSTPRSKGYHFLWLQVTCWCLYAVVSSIVWRKLIQ